MINQIVINDNLKEAIKEFFRVIVLAIIPILIEMLLSGSLDLKLVGITGAIAGLRFIDKYLHQVGKEIENNQKNKRNKKTSPLTTGLTRF